MAVDLLHRAPQRSPLTKLELEREARIAENRKRMEEMGVLETARNLMAAINASKPQRTFKPKQPRAPRVARPPKIRRSGRIRGRPAPDYSAPQGDAGLLAEGEAGGEAAAAESSDWEGSELDDLLAGDEDVSSWEPAKQEQFQEMRCTSANRGSVYDSHAGITCHFCRQKKLCGEEGCPRCSRRSASAECVGKTDCSRCHGATGRFCRACLLLRYGQTIEEARAQMEAGEWLCPHCYEEEHPDEGWMCNSSICMKRRGFKPTGIAIFDAQQRGYASVAHWLQAQLKKRGAAAVAADPAGTSEGGEGAGAPAEPRRSARRAAAGGAGEEASAAAGAGAAGGAAGSEAAADAAGGGAGGDQAAAAAPPPWPPAAARRAGAEATDAAARDAPASSREGSSEPGPAAAAAAPAPAPAKRAAADEEGAAAAEGGARGGAQRRRRA